MTAPKTAGASHVNPPGLYDPSRHGFSQVVVVPAQARLVYIAGQMAVGVDGKIMAPHFEGQVKGAFDNLRLALEGAGSSLDQVVNVTFLVADHDMDKEHIIARATNAAWPGHNKPASMLIPVPRLALDGLFFEVGAVGYIPG